MPHKRRRYRHKHKYPKVYRSRFKGLEGDLWFTLVTCVILVVFYMSI